MNKRLFIVLLCSVLYSNTGLQSHKIATGYQALFQAENSSDVRSFIASYPYVVAYVYRTPSYNTTQILENLASYNTVPGVSFVTMQSDYRDISHTITDADLRSLPAIILLKYGSPVAIRYGYLSSKELLELIDEHFQDHITTTIRSNPSYFISFGERYTPTWWHYRWRPSWWRRPSSYWSGWKYPYKNYRYKSYPRYNHRYGKYNNHYKKPISSRARRSYHRNYQRPRNRRGSWFGRRR